MEAWSTWICLRETILSFLTLAGPCLDKTELHPELRLGVVKRHQNNTPILAYIQSSVYFQIWKRKPKLLFLIAAADTAVPPLSGNDWMGDALGVRTGNLYTLRCSQDPWDCHTVPQHFQNSKVDSENKQKKVISFLSKTTSKLSQGGGGFSSQTIVSSWFGDKFQPLWPCCCDPLDNVTQLESDNSFFWQGKVVL